ncbi:MAG: LysE family translocator [Pseudomonadota bacterium]
MTWELFLLWIGWLVAGGSPGPATLAIAGTAMERGRPAALALALGVLAGSAVWGIAAAAGLSAVMIAHAWLFETLRYAGAAYLLYLALRAARSAIQTTGVGQGTPFAGGHRALFAKGAALHLTNPKAILSWGSIYALAAPTTATPGDLGWYFCAFYAGSLLIFPTYAVLFSSAQITAAYSRAKRGFEGAFAVFFGAASLKLLTARLP